MRTLITGKTKPGLTWIFTRPTIAIILFLAGLLSVQAQQSQVQSLTKDNQKMVDLITNKVMQNLLREGALDEAINRGIQRYIRQQRDAQARAQRDDANAAAAKAKDVRPASATRDHIYGNPDAVISLIEYSDFECPFCKRFHLTAQRIVDSNAGKVNWVYRHFPLSFHNPGAQTQAEASECAASLGGNDAFWKFSNTIYERTRSNGKGFPIEDLAPLAAEIGLDKTAFQNCLKSGKYTARVQEDLEEGIRIGITGTPGNILVNNKTGQAIPRAGAAPYESLQRVVDALLQSGS